MNTPKPILRMALAMTGAACAVPAFAADVQLQLEIPQQQGTRALRPYVAIWLEKAGDRSFAGNLAVWYDQHKRNNAGQKWLKDLREWWRVAGYQADLPADGISGATRAPGETVVALGASPSLAKLAPGAYEVVVEAAREHGGRDLVRLPLQWPPKPGTPAAQTTGQGELGTVKLTARP